jgi:hypothetical protein
MVALVGLVVMVVGSGVFSAGSSGAAIDRTDPVITSASFVAILTAQVPGDTAVHWRANGQADFVRHAVQEYVTVAPLTGSTQTPESQPFQIQTKWVRDHSYVTLLSGTLGLHTQQTLSVPESTTGSRSIDRALTQSAVALTYARDLLADISADGTRHPVGTRRIDGTRSTGTQVDLTLSQLLKVSPGLTPAMGGAMRAFGNVKMQATVWIDRTGRLVAVDLRSPSSTRSASISGSILFSHYNEPLTIAVPAAGSVKPITTALAQMLHQLHLLNRIPLP